MNEAIGPYDGFEPFERREREVEQAARSIVSLCRNDTFGKGWRPKGVDEVAILLESLGYSREIVAELWYPDLFALARDVTVAIDRYVTDEERAEHEDTAWFVHACRDYAIGSLYSGPWIIAVIGLAVFGASLWSSLSTPLHLATAIALGVYIAQMISGFYAQAIARRLTFYYLQRNQRLMLWTFDRFSSLAIATSVVCSVVLWLILRAYYGDPDGYLAASFCLGSAIFQLSLAPLYTLRRFGWIIAIAFIATVTTGVTFVAFFHRHVDVPWEPTTLALEIGIVGLLVLSGTRFALSRRARSTHEELVPPSLRSILSSTLPYASFGLLYFAAILADRVFSGIAGAAGHGYTYNGSYELGADVALLAILPVTGIVNVVLEALPRRILKGSQSRISGAASFERSMTRFYLGGTLAVLVATIAAVVLAEIIGPYVLASPRLGGGDFASIYVLRTTVIGYGLFMLGLLNVQLLFFLSRPRAPVIGAAAALAATLLWCAGCLIFGKPAQMMSAGLIAGAIAFVAITGAATLHAMRRFTYAYYAAY